jgi:hypothetical protein
MCHKELNGEVNMEIYEDIMQESQKTRARETKAEGSSVPNMLPSILGKEVQN